MRRFFCALLAAIPLTACGNLPTPQADPDQDAAAWAPTPQVTPAPATRMDDVGPTAYEIGPSDELRITVLGRPELCGEHVVGPDGAIAVPLVGEISVRGRTPQAAATFLKSELAPYFTVALSVTVAVLAHHNDSVHVLGEVEAPGRLKLAEGRRLLQVLAGAGGLSPRDGGGRPHRCAVFRAAGGQRWVDLDQLCEGFDRRLDLVLQPGDVVWVPDDQEPIVFVLGEVLRPGAVPVRGPLKVTGALAHAGGPTADAELESIWVVRDGKRPFRFDLRSLVEEGSFGDDLALRGGDVLYVSRSGMGDLGYVLGKIAPAMQTASLALTFGQFGGQ